MREIVCHSSQRPRAFWVAATFVAALGVGACRHGLPVIDTAPNPVEAEGTIRGTVRGPEGTSPIDYRAVEVVNAATGERQRATTNNVGGFSFKLKPGKYRVELTLHEGESLTKQPGVINLNRSDVDAQADFVVGPARVASPRPPTPRSDDGLGAAIG